MQEFSSDRRAVRRIVGALSGAVAIAAFTVLGVGGYAGALDAGAALAEYEYTADLTVDKVDRPDPVEVGETLTYKVSVRNDGPLDAFDVEVTDFLPTRATFVSASASQGTCSRAGQVVTCELGGLAAGGAARIVIEVTPTEAGRIRNRVTVKAATADPRAGNNFDRTKTRVVAVSPSRT